VTINKVTTIVKTATDDEIVIERNHREFRLERIDDKRWMFDVYVEHYKPTQHNERAVYANCYRNHIEMDWLKPGYQIWFTGEFFMLVRLISNASFDERWSNNPMHTGIFYRDTEREFLLYDVADGIYAAIAQANAILDEDGDVIYHADYDAAVEWITAHKAEADAFDIV
jgi:hypothetical protein